MSFERILLLNENLIDDATLSGGGYEADMPITNIQDRILSNAARSTDATLANTQVDITLDKARRVLGVGAFAHNLSTDAKVRLRGWTGSLGGTEVYNSGWVFAWTAPLDETRDWEDADYWEARPTNDAVDGFRWAVVLPVVAGVKAQYWRLEIDDTGNADGYVEIGRIYIGGGWQPSVNPAHDGDGLTWVDDSEIEASQAGVEFARLKRPYRVFTASIQNVSDDEGFARASGIQQRSGRTKEIFVIPRPDDPKHMQRRAFLGTLRNLSPLEAVSHNLSGWAVEIKEER